MRTTLRSIKEASLCFRRHSLSTQQIDSRSKEARIAERVIQKSYRRTLESGFKPNWKTIIGWVDSLVFQDLDLNNKEQWDQGKICSEHILVFLNNWYKKILIPEQLLAYPSITISEHLSPGVVESTIPIIKLSDPVTILSVSNIVQNSWQLYNDIEVRGQMWLVANSLHVDKVTYHRLNIGSRGGTEETIIHMDQKGLDSAAKMIFQVMRQMEMKVNYPVISERCDSCEFKRRCMI